MEKVVLAIGGMSCQGCVRNITGLLQALPGVAAVEVSLEAGQARISYDAQLSSIAQFTHVIENAGFDVL